MRQTAADAVRHARVQAELKAARTRDPIGDKIHTALAAGYFLTLPIAPSPNAIAMALLLIWAIARLHHTWRSYIHCLVDPLLWLLVAYTAWHALSLAWSIDPKQGFDELSAYRVLIVPLLVWPVLDRLPWLIGASLAGVLVQNGMQALQGLEVVELQAHDDERWRGLMHPIQTGAWCAAAMAWHLSAALHGRAKLRWISIALLCVAALGLMWTGSRGPWIAAGLAMPIAIVLTMIRRRDMRPIAIWIGAAGLAASLAAWPLVHDRVESRIVEAIEEIRLAREHEVYYTSTGLRIALSRWAWEIFQEHPIIGVGAGGFPKAHRERPSFQAAMARNPEEAEELSKDHPHSVYLYTLACLGIVGAVLTAAVLGIVFLRAWKTVPDHVYADGMLWAYFTWLIGAQFDCYNLNGQTFGLFVLIVCGVMLYRPDVRQAVLA